MSKRKRHKLTLTQSQKRRQWEFFVLRDRRNHVLELLKLAELGNQHEAAVRLQNELDAIELRGSEIVQEQTHFLRMRERHR